MGRAIQTGMWMGEDGYMVAVIVLFCIENDYFGTTEKARVFIIIRKGLPQCVEKNHNLAMMGRAVCYL